MASNVVLTYNNPVNSGDTIEIQDSNIPSVLISLVYGTPSLPVSGNLDIDILNARTFIENNYNATNRYIVFEDLFTKTLTITDNIGSSTFTETTNNTSGRVTSVITNDPVYIPVSISSITLLENATDPCNLVDIEILTFTQVTEITSPVIQPILTNPFTITDVPRDTSNSILISVNDGITSDADSVYVPVILPILFDLDIVIVPNGGTVTAIYNGQPPNITFQYSLDNLTFFNSSSFSGLTQGNYTLYIKDNIGCTISIPFEITAFQPNVFERVPYFNISEQNSLITVLCQEVNNTTIFKNPLNTLSYREDSQVNNRGFKQLYQKTDGVITQQYRSNYDSVDIKLIDCNGNETILLSEQKSNNFNITDVRDVKILEVDYFGSAFVGVQYGVGNTYDPNSLVINGSYNLGTETPNFMNIDDYIQIEGAGWFRVTDISYYDGLETLVLEVLVNDFPIAVTGQTLRGTSVYNKLPYELYEFSFDLSLLDGDYYIKYNTVDSEFDTIEYVTEYFNVSDNQPYTYFLQYYNTEPNETNYNTGITNKIRIPYINTLTYSPNDTQDVYLTDTNAVNIESEYRDLYELDIKPIPKGFVRKIGLALSNDRLFLNGLSLLKNSELETERIGLSNLYTLTAKFIRSDYAFSNIANDGSIVPLNGEVLGTNDITDTLLSVKDN